MVRIGCDALNVPHIVLLTTSKSYDSKSVMTAESDVSTLRLRNFTRSVVSLRT